MKNLFLLDPSLVFLNHGSFGACPVKVLEKCQQWQREMERNPVEFLGRRSGQLVARSIPLRAGDEILTTNHEYGACDNTWRFVCQHTGAKYVPVEIPLPFRAQEFMQRVWAGVTPRPRVLFVSHIASTTALIFPLAQLCQRA